ncbi:uncharacterized protein B0I36DRAFT_344649 [Microdochium trichocladiopsis]|uniref:Uncharacterized protein n=1 Tax=Microdochium trichocladiopsis TaxID=1682393 RepID=A0A9P8YJ96_9PEZI|nr:uncharacterized protein B0I36DRAFT_344649 [Microdochium trichocladiopsis]KAH7041002.1 hypothetical protein B0I36DRAFT_344649 [Microdochium trichocladiopsis]
MAPTSEEFRNIAEQAERDLNTYQAKTGAGKQSSNDDAGVDTSVERKFPGAKVEYGDDLKTNAGYNRKIPVEEGGDVDVRGRETRGEHFEGRGGPEDKLARQERDFGGNDELDPADRRGNRNTGSSGLEGSAAQAQTDVMQQGKEFSNINMASKTGQGHTKFPGDEYYTPESVPGSIAAQGYEPPESVIESSKDAEGYL